KPVRLPLHPYSVNSVWATTVLRGSLTRWKKMALSAVWVPMANAIFWFSFRISAIKRPAFKAGLFIDSRLRQILPIHPETPHFDVGRWQSRHEFVVLPDWLH